MRSLIWFLCLQMVFTPTLRAQSSDPNCDPTALREWMVQRQVGRNQIQPLLEADRIPDLLEATIEVQAVRRALEDLPRPMCADSLYILTVYLYDSITDYFILQLRGQNAFARELIDSRFVLYGDRIDVLYQPLEAIAGVDVLAEAAAIDPIPVAVPTTILAEPVHLEDARGGVVVGPVDIPPGLYRLTLRGGGNQSASGEPMDSGCPSFFIYLPPEGGATQEIFRSGGCRILIEIGAGSTGWQIDFEPTE